MNSTTEKNLANVEAKTGEERFWRQIGHIKRDEGVECSVSAFKCYPDVAEYLLSLNTFDRQRNLSDRSVAKFVKALHEDSFAPGSMIRLTWSFGRWVLTDGQHRLHAIAESGLAVNLTALFVFRDINVEYATVDSIGGLRSPREIAIAYGHQYCETITGRNLDRFLSACKIIDSNFQSNNHAAADKLHVTKFAADYVDAMTALKEWGAGSSIFGGTTGAIKASVLSVALITVKYAPSVIAEEFWVNAFQNDGLRRRDVRRLLNEIITASTHGGIGEQHEIVKITANLWNSYVDGKKELDKVYTPKTMPEIKLTPYPLKDKEQKSL